MSRILQFDTARWRVAKRARAATHISFGSAALATIFVLSPVAGFAQVMAAMDSAIALQPVTPGKPAVLGELITEGGGSFGHFMFSAGEKDSLFFYGGMEYDRHSWGSFLRSEVDYAAEVLPVGILREPALADTWGDALSRARKLDPGVGIYPGGFRLLWRGNRAIKPYMDCKGGFLFFSQRALAAEGGRLNLTFQGTVGTQIKLTNRMDWRAGAGYLHFSNGYMAPENPGLDEILVNTGVSYHLGK